MKIVKKCKIIAYKETAISSENGGLDMDKINVQILLQKPSLNSYKRRLTSWD